MKQIKMIISDLKIAAIIALAAALLASCKKEVFEKKLTQEFTMQSVSNNATYKIQVGLPCNYDPASKKHETIYVLDGETDFSVVANQCQKIAACKGVQNVIVVGIGYGNDRANDYTPTKTEMGDGGAQKFMEFIKNELIPKMETDFGSDTARSKRVILGHSFGGLFAAYAFTLYNDVFGNYIILSPSIWYDNEVMLQYEQDTRSLNKTRKQLVFMGLGELENSGRMPAPFEAFYQRLNNNYPNMKLTKNLPADLDHMGSKAPNITAGLNSYFNNR